MLALYLSILLFFPPNDTPDYINEYDKLSSKKEELTFINKYQNKSNVDITAYVVSLRMKQAEYKFLPWKKLEIFNKEKKNLESLIKKYPKNIHLRYMRLVIQENIPKILFYNSNIKEDKIFLKQMIAKKDNTDYLDKYIIKNTSL
jgi:hypothetical protein